MWVWLVITAHINHPNLKEYNIKGGGEDNFCPRQKLSMHAQLMVLYMESSTCMHESPITNNTFFFLFFFYNIFCKCMDTYNSNLC